MDPTHVSDLPHILHISRNFAAFVLLLVQFLAEALEQGPNGVVLLWQRLFNLDRSGVSPGSAGAPGLVEVESWPHHGQSQETKEQLPH